MELPFEADKWTCGLALSSTVFRSEFPVDKVVGRLTVHRNHASKRHLLKGNPPMKSANASVTGMTRFLDHMTSIAAAEKILKRELTIRERVTHFALSRPYGFTDDDLKAAFPDSPESSYRKRRSELSKENIIVPRGDEKLNRARNEETIWMHRDHMQFPPPIKPRQAAPSRFALLQEENARLRAAATAAQRVECALAATFLREMAQHAASDGRYNGLIEAAAALQAGKHRA